MVRSFDGPHRVVLYGAPGCHLCEEARLGLQRLAIRTPFVFREVDIHSDPDLAHRWVFEIPVIEVDGAVVTQAPVDLEAVRRALEGPRKR
jgi:predicted thioredoxin/glutaredoxin